MCRSGCCASLRKRGKLDLIHLIFGSGFHVCDVVFDIYVAIQYAERDEWWWFAFTLAFVMLPIITTNFLASPENETAHKKLTFLARSLFIVLIRYKKDFCQWKKTNCDNKPCGKSDYWNCSCRECKTYREEKKNSAESSCNLAIVRYVEAMSESAPQWCLQNYVMLRQWYFPWYTVLSTVFSFLSLAWGITSLEKAEKTYRWFYHHSVGKSYPTKSFNTVFFAWQLCSLLSRLSALVFFAYVFRYYVFVFFGLNIILLTTASYNITKKENELVKRKTSRFSKLLKCMSFSYFMIFHISGSVSRPIFGEDFKFKHRRLAMFLYQIVLWLGNILLVSLAVWHAPAGTTHNKHLEIIVLCFVFVGLVLSIIFIALYYKCFHPSKSVQENEGTFMSHLPDDLVSSLTPHVQVIKSARINSRRLPQNSTVINNPNVNRNDTGIAEK